jgi:hypothetical protein
VPEALSITAPFLVAVVLVWSAIGKLRDPTSASEGFTALAVPAALSRPWMVRAHPWVEIALAVLLLVGAGWLGVVGAVGALALMLAYLALVARAVQRGDDVDCACFGAWGPGRVTMRTVWRNGWLVVMAGLSVWAAVDGPSLLSRATEADAGWWVVGLGAALLTAALVLAGEGGSEALEAGPPQYSFGDDELEDYVPVLTPAVPVTLADGTTSTLRELSAARAQLLLFVSEGCGSCVGVIAAVPAWRTELPQLDVRLVVAVPPDTSSLASLEEPQTLHDAPGWVRQSFGTGGTPSAMLLGANGYVAGGPVAGADAVRAFVEEIRAQLAAVV